MEVWESEPAGRIILPSGQVLEVEQEITAEAVKKAAAEAGIKKFVVRDAEGNPLSPADFPRTGEVVVEEYNEAA